MNTLQELNRAADNIRILSAAMVEKAKFSTVDIADIKQYNSDTYIPK